MLSRRNLIRSLPAAAAALYSSCSEPPPPSRRSRAPKYPLKVVTTTTFAAELARGVGKDGVETQCLVPPGTNPHLWKPTAPDIAAMRLADVVLFHGLGLERNYPETRESLEQFGVQAVNLTDAIPPDKLIASDSGDPDPHVWMDPLLWIHCADEACRAMTAVLPNYREYFESSAHEHKVVLRRLHERCLTQLQSGVSGTRRVLSSHDTLRYFAATYDLEIRSLANALGDAPAAVPQDLMDWITTHRVSWLFHEQGTNLQALRDLFPLSLIQEYQPIYSLSLAQPGTILSATAEPLRVEFYPDAFRWTVDIIARGTAG